MQWWWACSDGKALCSVGPDSPWTTKARGRFSLWPWISRLQRSNCNSNSCAYRSVLLSSCGDKQGQGPVQAQHSLHSWARKPRGSPVLSHLTLLQCQGYPNPPLTAPRRQTNTHRHRLRVVTEAEATRERKAKRQGRTPGQ